MSEPLACPQEPLVVSAAGSSLSEALSIHVKNCASCREARALALQMQSLLTIHMAGRPPDADVIWMMARLSNPRTTWTRETLKGVAALAASALGAAIAWPTIIVYMSNLFPKSGMAAVPFLSSCVIAVGLALVAAKTMRLLTGD